MNPKNDDKNGIDAEVAEILGAFIGDGWIENRQNALYITGNPTEDKDYYDNYLAPLLTKKFSRVKPKNFTYWGVYGIAIYRKEIIGRAIKLGFQVGKKSLVARIPNNFLNYDNEEIFKAIIRGIFDTDGSFWCEKSRSKTSSDWKQKHHHHPELRITSCSKELLEQIQKLLDRLDIIVNDINFYT